MLAQISQVAGQRFDYIIVGGGTAGLAVAARLSEDPAVSVLVLEAGESNLDETAHLIPGRRWGQFNNPKFDWAYKTINQTHSNDRAYPFPRGKGLGGSTVLNFMLWNKPAREYLEAFGQLGNQGWNWELFEKYSKRVEKFTEPDHDLDVLTYDLAHRGTSGVVDVSFPTVISNVERPLIEAMKKHGIPHILDSSSGFTNGISAMAATVNPKTHERAYAATMYYVPVSSRSNLTVLVSAHVAEIVTQSNGDGTLTASGVKFIYGGEIQEATCAKEVCLAAGAIMSPQILELSGIGDRKILQKAGIDTKIHLPGVGTNVQEHLFSGMTYVVKEHVIAGREVNTTDPVFVPGEAAKHVAIHPTGKGAMNLIIASLTFVPFDTICADAAKFQRDVSDVILTNIKENKYPSGLRKQYELQLKHLQQKVPSLEIMLAPGPIAPPRVPDINTKHITLAFALNSPFSRGTIHAVSKDPQAHPEIDPHIYEEPYDLLTMVELVKFNRRLVQTEPLKTILGDETVPGPSVQTDEEIADWLRRTVNVTHHTIGSCSMLPLEDGGVVDSRLKVYHTTNIRVADMSIVPLHVGSHTQALAYAVGEQAADIIKGII